MPKPKLADWTESDLRRFVLDILRTTPTTIDKLVIADLIVARLTVTDAATLPD